MKTNSTYSTLLRVISSALLLFITIQLAAQPDYDFHKPVLESAPGTDLKIGAVYRFSDVKPGVDGIVTLMDITGGVSIAEIDGTSGYDEALQPSLNSPAFTNGYVEMKVDFVYSGTNKSFQQKEVPVTCIDVDGVMDNDGLGRPLFEFDQVKMGGGYIDYKMSGTELSVLKKGAWVTGKNIMGIDYPGRDTVAKQVMFTSVNANISSFTIRVGVDNQSALDSYRLRSIYFKKFNYGNGILPVSDLLSFKGTAADNDIALEWSLLQDHKLSQVILEKGTAAGQFTTLKEFNLSETGNNKLKFYYTDNGKASANTFYRLKMITENGSFKYSNILSFKSVTALKNEFKVYPSLVQSSVAVNISLSANEHASFNVLDYTGRIIKQQDINLQKGENNFQISNLDRLPSGNYIVIVKTSEKMYSSKISKQ
jgi:hypothetical protein